MKYSVVVPVYNEEANISPLYDALNSVMHGLGNYEIIFVNDGSRDGTLANLMKVKKSGKNVRIIDFPHNFGKSAALRAGFDLAKGDIIITIDGDLQNDPKDIPLLIQGLKNYDVVSGWRRQRRDKAGKIAASKLFNHLQRKLFSVPIHDSNCGLKAYKREAVEDLSLYGELHRYIPAILFKKGYSIGEVQINHHPRMYGRSKYGTITLLRGFLDLIDVKLWSTFETRPLHFFGTVGFMMCIIGVLLGVVLLILRLLEIKYLTKSILPLLSVGLLLVGLQFVILGLLASMLVRVDYVSQNKKPYRIRRII